MTKKKILIVEDDLAIGNLIKMALEINDYDYALVTTGSEALRVSLSLNPDGMILDLGLPDMDGKTVIEKTRQWSNLPIIVVSARGEEQDKVQALDLGADDYVTKPFSVDELLARIRVALRRTQDGSQKTNQQTFTNGPLRIDYSSNCVWMNDVEIHLTPNEYKLLETLSRHVGKVLTHNFLLKSIWHDALDTDIPNLRVFMATLRKKLEQVDNSSKIIQTHIRVGYRMLHIEN